MGRAIYVAPLFEYSGGLFSSLPFFNGLPVLKNSIYAANCGAVTFICMYVTRVGRAAA